MPDQSLDELITKAVKDREYTLFANQATELREQAAKLIERAEYLESQNK